LGGAVRVSSEPTQGTCAEVILPVDAPSPGACLGPSKPDAALLVCAEGGTAALAHLSLEALGFQVLWANSLERALATCARPADEVCLLVVEDAIARREAAVLHRTERAGQRLPTLVMEDRSTSQPPNLPGGALRPALREPWTIGQFTSMVREVLSE